MNESGKPKRPSLLRPKLTDVAKLANVSLATASRALAQPNLVRPEVRERVRQAVDALGYAPDRMAKALSSGKSHTIGAVVPTLGNAIFADGVEALQERLEQLGYILLLSNSQYDQQKEYRQIRALLEHGVDGLILVGNNFLYYFLVGKILFEGSFFFKACGKPFLRIFFFWIFQCLSSFKNIAYNISFDLSQ